jgi:glycogen operon protein
MVYNLHEAGIEVILDVVYNHTAEGHHLGPILSYKGIDNPAYYRLVEDDPQYYMDYTGTGNSLNIVIRSCCNLMDSLRVDPKCTWTGSASIWPRPWARELGVDLLSAFFDIIHQTRSSTR